MSNLTCEVSVLGFVLVEGSVLVDVLMLHHASTTRVMSWYWQHVVMSRQWLPSLHT